MQHTTETETLLTPAEVAASGEALATAQALAGELAAYPQVCLRGDRASVLEQWGLSQAEALAVEYQHGLQALRSEAVAGATRFVDGAGRHGAF